MGLRKATNRLGDDHNNSPYQTHHANGGGDVRGKREKAMRAPSGQRLHHERRGDHDGQRHGRLSPTKAPAGRTEGRAGSLRQAKGPLCPTPMLRPSAVRWSSSSTQTLAFHPIIQEDHAKECEFHAEQRQPSRGEGRGERIRSEGQGNLTSQQDREDFVQHQQPE